MMSNYNTFSRPIKDSNISLPRREGEWVIHLVTIGRTTLVCFLKSPGEKIIHYQPFISERGLMPTSIDIQDDIESTMGSLIGTQDIIESFLFTESYTNESPLSVQTSAEPCFLSQEVKSFFAQKKVTHLINRREKETLFYKQSEKLKKNLKRYAHDTVSFHLRVRKDYDYQGILENEGDWEILFIIITATVALYNNVLEGKCFDVLDKEDEEDKEIKQRWRGFYGQKGTSLGKGVGKYGENEG